MMADLVVKAAYATVAEDDGLRFIGFVDALDEAYALFRQPLAGGPVWVEVNDEDFGAEDAIAAIEVREGSLEVTLKPELAGDFGYAGSFAVRLKHCEGADAALAALSAMLGVDLRAG